MITLLKARQLRHRSNSKRKKIPDIYCLEEPVFRKREVLYLGSKQMTPGILSRSCKAHHKSGATFTQVGKKKPSFLEYSVWIRNYSDLNESISKAC